MERVIINRVAIEGLIGSVIFCELTLCLQCLKAHQHGRWKDYFPGGNNGFFQCVQKYFSVKLYFTKSETKRKTFFCKKVNSKNIKFQNSGARALVKSPLQVQHTRELLITAWSSATITLSGIVFP